MLNRTPCLGPCPVFRARLARDGSVLYDGREFARIKGTRIGRLPEGEFDEIAHTVAACAFDELTGRYWPMRTCIPFAHTVVESGSRALAVMSTPNWGPLSLDHLHARIERALGRVRWQQASAERIARAMRTEGPRDEELRPRYDEEALARSLGDATSIRRISLTSVGRGQTFWSHLGLEIIRSGSVWYRNGLDAGARRIRRGSISPHAFTAIAHAIAECEFGRLPHSVGRDDPGGPTATFNVTTPAGSHVVTTTPPARAPLRALQDAIINALRVAQWVGPPPRSVRERIAEAPEASG